MKNRAVKMTSLEEKLGRYEEVNELGKAQRLSEKWLRERNNVGDKRFKVRIKSLPRGLYSVCETSVTVRRKGVPKTKA